jgi:hypothetical protein
MALTGAGRGLAWSVPVAVLVAVQSYDPAVQPVGFASVLVAIIGIWTAILTCVSVLRADATAWLDKYQLIVRDRARLAALLGLILGVLGSLGLVPILLPRERPGSTLPVATISIVIGLTLGTVCLARGLGLIWGKQLAQRTQAADARQLLDLLPTDKLSDQRHELQHAIESRFGKLGDVARERLLAWDGDRLALAHQRLAQAKSLDELGLPS